MSHLLAMAVGPIQDFIAAARRTRDLWFGSFLLSEISRAVAQAVEVQGGKLIFPATLDAESIANIVVAELESGDPRAIANHAKKAAQQRWLEFASEVKQEVSDVIRHDIWADQVDDVIEFYAAWVQQTGAYGNDRARLMRLLAGRKNCREFEPAKGRAGVPKSSLDGQRESVLKPPSDWPKRFRARLRIREGEQLDVVGLVKRIAGGSQPYPSVSRIAADPWTRGNQNQLGPVIAACKALGNRIIREINTDVHPHYKTFPFDGSAVYVNRHHELIEETEVSREELRSLRESLFRLPQPEPYLAVLVADGDRIGATISGLNSADLHRQFSHALAGFSETARAIVNNHNGVLVYAGGDDVLALLPVDTCLDCASKLHDDFATRLKTYGDQTLSVGIAIGHFMENLEDLLDYGRAAEKAAKSPDRDGLALHLHKRGGAPIKVRSRWKDDPQIRLMEFAKLMNNGTIPTKLPYELRSMVTLYEPWNVDADEAIRIDLIRLIARKQSRGTDTVRSALDGYLNGMNSKKLLSFAEELLVARQIATVLRQTGEEVAS